MTAALTAPAFDMETQDLPILASPITGLCLLYDHLLHGHPIVTNEGTPRERTYRMLPEVEGGAPQVIVRWERGGWRRVGDGMSDLVAVRDELLAGGRDKAFSRMLRTRSERLVPRD